ncbi:MAG TPA: hypothetical protein VKP88_00210 [Candidatus Paceibacterota bacterium]|nr:hypothetical protein [Candidatus Paceibacterota bacterium]
MPTPKSNLHALGQTPLEPNAVLEVAKAADLKECIVVGYTEEGQVYISSSDLSVATVTYLLEAAKLDIMLHPS